jgi:phage/plasmid-like protein (TIGR03299 family)
MAHNIYNDGSKDCMFVVGDRKAAWHELGQRCDTAVTWEEAIKLAGLDWTVLKQENYARNPAGNVVKTGSCAIFRSSDNQVLGTVGPDFQVKQNRECFAFIDTLLESNGGAHYDSAGALGNGARIWCAVRVPKADMVVAGSDQHETYLVFATAHDGSLSHTVKLTSVRVVCQNTLQASLSDAGAMFKVKHTKNADARLGRAKDLMTGVVQDAKSLEEKLNLLATRRLTLDSLTTITDRLFPKPDDKASEASRTRRDNLLADVLKLYESNDRDAIPVIRGTAYNLLNAVTEYTDHFRNARITEGREDAGYTLVQARAENAVMGTGDRLKSEALEVILEGTKDCPTYSPIWSRVAPSGSGTLLDDVMANHN